MVNNHFYRLLLVGLTSMGWKPLIGGDYQPFPYSTYEKQYGSRAKSFIFTKSSVVICVIMVTESWLLTYLSTPSEDLCTILSIFYGLGSVIYLGLQFSFSVLVLPLMMTQVSFLQTHLLHWFLSQYDSDPQLSDFTFQKFPEAVSSRFRVESLSLNCYSQNLSLSTISLLLIHFFSSEGVKSVPLCIS